MWMYLGAIVTGVNVNNYIGKKIALSPPNNRTKRHRQPGDSRFVTKKINRERDGQHDDAPNLSDRTEQHGTNNAINKRLITPSAPLMLQLSNISVVKTHSTKHLGRTRRHSTRSERESPGKAAIASDDGGWDPTETLRRRWRYVKKITSLYPSRVEVPRMQLGG